MKNLANCSPTEFLSQTVKIKRLAESWIKETEIMEIRRETPELVQVTADMSKQAKKDAIEENAKRMRGQSMKNLSRIYDSIAEEHPKETLELLALMCFVEPEDVDSHPMMEYISNVLEMLNNESVVSFFTLLARLGQMNTQRR